MQGAGVFRVIEAHRQQAHASLGGGSGGNSRLNQLVPPARSRGATDSGPLGAHHSKYNDYLKQEGCYLPLPVPNETVVEEAIEKAVEEKQEDKEKLRENIKLLKADGKNDEGLLWDATVDVYKGRPRLSDEDILGDQYAQDGNGEAPVAKAKKGKADGKATKSSKADAMAASAAETIARMEPHMQKWTVNIARGMKNGPYYTWLFVGRRGSGKSWSMRDVIFHTRHLYPRGLVCIYCVSYPSITRSCFWFARCWMTLSICAMNTSCVRFFLMKLHVAQHVTILPMS